MDKLRLVFVFLNFYHFHICKLFFFFLAKCCTIGSCIVFGHSWPPCELGIGNLKYLLSLLKIGASILQHCVVQHTKLEVWIVGCESVAILIPLKNSQKIFC